MYFVPEGQHDSSQVRSAWVAIQKDPVPKGRSNATRSPLYARRYTRPRSVQSSRWDGAIFLITRHFVPGYYQPVPPGQRPFGPRARPSAATGGICFHVQPHLVIPLCGSFVILRKRETSGLPPNNRVVVVSIF